MVRQPSALRNPAIATVITSLLLAACGAGATTSAPTSTRSASQTAVPTATKVLEAAPVFIHSDTISMLPGESLGLAVADLNEDGKLDLATVTLSRLGVVVLLGRGDGTFETGPDIEVAAADFVRAADLDGDGHVDLVAAGDRPAVLLGKGDGTFEAPVYYAIGPDLGTSDLNLRSVGIADLDGDKIPDLVAANWVGSQLAVLPGKGDGTFEPAALYPCLDCIAVALGDLNNDGAFDVVASSFPPPDRFTPDVKGTSFVFLNEGGGHLSEPVEYDPRGNAVAVALGDLNGDGALDVITANDRSYSVAVLLGSGDGTFARAQTYAAANTYGVVVADLDGDGKLDVLSGSSEDTKAWFYRGTGDGGLIETQGIEVAPDVPLGLVVVDLNGDGKLDLALTEEGSSHSLVSIFLGK